MKGPAKVLERRGVVTYKIKFDDDQKRTCHINMLEKYISRDELKDRVGISPVTASVQQASHEDKDKIEDDDNSLGRYCSCNGVSGRE